MTADQVRAAVDPRDAELARLRERNAWLESARVAWRHWRAETKRHAAEHHQKAHIKFFLRLFFGLGGCPKLAATSSLGRRDRDNRDASILD